MTPVPVVNLYNQRAVPSLTCKFRGQGDRGHVHLVKILASCLLLNITFYLCSFHICFSCAVGQDEILCYSGTSFMKYSYHALSEFLRGARLRHRRGMNSGLMGLSRTQGTRTARAQFNPRPPPPPVALSTAARGISVSVRLSHQMCACCLSHGC